MNNSDFRKLLETPRAERGGGQTPSNKPQAAQKPKQSSEHKPHRPHGRPGFKKPVEKSTKEDAEDDGAPKYRDRAEERRRDKNTDYEDAAAVLSAMAGGGGVDLSKLSEQETKYLGGDMRFTHMVKGLDHALLQKTRSEITKRKDGEGDEEEDAEAADGLPGQRGGSAAAGAGAGKEAARDAQARANARANAASAAGRKEEVRFRTPLARSVFSTLFSPPRGNVREMYLPRRTAFVYDFDNEDVRDTDVPTTLRRPKSECPPVVETLFAGMDTAVLDRIARIMSYMRTTADGKRLKRRDRDALLGIKHETTDGQAADGPGGGGGGGPPPPAPAPSGALRPARPADEDDDIFGDVGTDYKPTNNKAKAKDAGRRDQTGRRADGSYFDTKDTMADIPMPGTSIRRGGAAAAEAAAAGGGGTADDMDLEEGEMAPPPPPPLPPPPPSDPAAAYGQQQYAAGYAAGGGYGQYGAYGNESYGQDAAAAQYAAAGAQGVYGAAAYGGAMPYQGQDAAAGGQAAVANAYGTAEEPKWRSRPKDTKARALDTEADDDAYAECYPGMAGYVGALVDSDDEGGGGDLAHMDSKQAKGKTRADFATDEEWQRHKESRETLPRAAFQYGVKRADGRKSHKELEKGAVVEQRQRDQKLDGQLRKIERLLQDKGHDHAGAFARKPKDGGGEGGAGGGGGGDGGGGRGDETPSVFRKRQRI